MRELIELKVTKKPLIAKGFRWIMQQSHGCRSMLVLLAGARLGLSAANLGTAVIIKAFTDFATGDAQLQIHSIVLAALMLVLIEGGLQVVSTMSTKLACGRMERKIRLAMMSATTNSKLLYVQKIHTGEILTRMTKDAEQVASCLPTLINTVLGGMLMALIALIYMFILSWKLSIAVLIVIPLTFIVIGVFSPRLQHCVRKDKENEAINRTQMQDALNGILLIQSYHIQKLVLEELGKTYDEKYKSTRVLGIIEGLFSFMNNAAGSLMFLVVMGFGAFLAFNNELTVGGMFAVVQMLNYIVWPFSNISNAISQVNQAAISAERINEIIDLPKCVGDMSSESVLPISEVVLDNIDFAYQPNEPILKGVCAQFHPGEITGIFGQSGSGKSTLLRVMLGLYEADHGEVYLKVQDAGDNRRLKGAEAGAYMSFVPSDNLIYPGTIKENICLGAEEDENKLWECAKTANILNEILNMNQGMDTYIGNGGVQLSSGQCQRIGIARALYRNAQVLIMDEPTSNLDQTSIALLQKTIEEIAKDRTVIVVTHDLNMASICGKRYILENFALKEDVNARM